MPRPRRWASDEERLLAGVVCDVATQCWIYVGVRNKGYGQLSVGPMRTVRTHRLAYELFVGPLDPSQQIHHECGNKACCNPTHLRPIADLEHKRLTPGWVGNRTHCKHGHPLSGDNLVVVDRANAKRLCRTCRNARAREYRARNLFKVRAHLREYARQKRAEKKAHQE